MNSRPRALWVPSSGAGRMAAGSRSSTSETESTRMPRVRPWTSTMTMTGRVSSGASPRVNRWRSSRMGTMAPRRLMTPGM